MQIFCNIKINEFQDDVVVIIVPHLNRNFILGYDILKNYCVIIDASKDMLYSEKFKLKAEFIKNSREKQISSYGLYIVNEIDINDIDYYTDDDISDL